MLGAVRKLPLIVVAMVAGLLTHLPAAEASTLGISATGSSVSEELQPLSVVTIKLSRPARATVRLRWKTTSLGSATPGVDYQSSKGMVVIPKGRTSGSLNVIINDDSIAEPSEVFGVKFRSKLVKPRLAVVTIKDDDSLSKLAGDLTVTIPVDSSSPGHVYGGATTTTLHLKLEFDGCCQWNNVAGSTYDATYDWTDEYGNCLSEEHASASGAALPANFFNLGGYDPRPEFADLASTHQPAMWVYTGLDAHGTATYRDSYDAGSGSCQSVENQPDFVANVWREDGNGEIWTILPDGGITIDQTIDGAHLKGTLSPVK